MAVVSVKVDDATARSLDEIAKQMRMETGQLVTRSDVVKLALSDLIRGYNA